MDAETTSELPMTSRTRQFDLREWAMRRVQWNPARNAIKYGVLGEGR
jgi:hypothetical protein